MTWPGWEAVATWLLGAPLRIVGVLLAAVVVRWLVHRAIRSLVDTAVARADDHERSSIERLVGGRRPGDAGERRRQRALTMGSLLRSASTFVIATIAILTVMADLGLPLAPLLTSAGIGGVALGFGAQSLVKDFLSGIFMIIEDQYGVGDLVDTGEAVGTVEEVTLRVTRLRDASGVVWFIRNGEIVRIGNKSQGWAVATIDVPVAYDEDPHRVTELLSRVVAETADDPAWADRLLETPTVAGVESVSGGTMTMRIFAKTRPGEQFAIPREIRERAKHAFDEAGVRGPTISPWGGGQPS
ncbi:mechanosensitive ion channel protein MscS [Ornithinimicrobium sp. CNJ-824]|uniref:mechanosensitive ion channel family protein n=1 Tax=Ornithinimicrobium sp. CNJ-824 TaxID=1904966 RepID=UPI000961280E|nr:mechanosensitive ion channel family protein [Ornithinimicrobium sp. CNJ-824]OLT20152.1 mechanosensitive ion channel protein MscS [Ornithinimicrobium sp. CNJ-824]